MKAFSPRLPYLDSARGFAALSVITWHCFTVIISHLRDSSLNNSPFHFFWYGEADVIFFFIHSGFILSYSHDLFEKELHGKAYLTFLIRRIFRIYPLFLFVLFLSWFLKSSIFHVHTSGYGNNHLSVFWNNPTGISDLLKQGLLAIRIPENATLRLIPQDWTLSVEILICPFLPFLNFFKWKWQFQFWLLILVLIKVFHFNTFLFEFSVGVYLYKMRNVINRLWKKSNLLIKMVFLAFAICLYTCFFNFPQLFDSKFFSYSPAIDRLLVVTGCSLFFIYILNSEFLQKLLSHTIFVRIGKICYSLYVNHFFLLICFANPVLTLLYRFIKGPDWLIIFLFIIFFQLLTALISLCTYRIIEKPFNIWGRQIGRKLFGFISNRTVKEIQTTL
jgi:peptidoglycan/LPS O-acetylase OafA/YrhL